MRLERCEGVLASRLQLPQLGHCSVMTVSMMMLWRCCMCWCVDLTALLCVRVYDVIRRDPGVVGRAQELNASQTEWKPAVR